MSPDIINNIQSILKEHGKLEGSIPPESDIYAELGVESVNSINILLALEEQFRISIDDTLFIKARTMKQLASLVHETIN